MVKLEERGEVVVAVVVEMALDDSKVVEAVLEVEFSDRLVVGRTVVPSEVEAELRVSVADKVVEVDDGAGVEPLLPRGRSQ